MFKSQRRGGDEQWRTAIVGAFLTGGGSMTRRTTSGAPSVRAGRFTRFRAALAAGAIAAISVVGPMAAPAAASTPTTATGSGFVCNAAASSSFNSTYALAKEYLPITRWSSVAGNMHDRLSGGLLGFGAIVGGVQRSIIESGALTIGNALWRTGTGITDVSSRFCVSDSVGYQADRMSASLGNAILSSGIIVLLVVVGLTAAIWKAAKGEPKPWRKVMSSLVTVGILGAMIHGASATTDSGGNIQFGTFSPGWLINKTYGLVDNFASLPASVIASQSNGLNGLAGNQSGPLSCAQYEQNMLNAYKASFGPGNASQAALPLTLDAMWEQTGLRTYINAQFGTSNPYGGYAFCRLLDSQAGIPPLRQMANSKAAAAGLIAQTNPTAPAWTSTGSTNTEVDTSLVGWAACRPNGNGWKVDPAWAQVTNPINSDPTGGPQITPSTCKNWWTSTNPNWASGGSLDWGSNPNNIQQGASGQPTVADYLYNLHGNYQAPSIASAVTFAFSSVITFLVFLLLGLAVIIAKIALLFLMMLLGLVAALSLVPSHNGGNRLAGVGKHVFGMIVFSAGAQVLLALVALITGELVLMSGALAGTGSLMAILLTSFAPIAAVVILHFTFTKVLKAPSPFRPSGALQYGKLASSGAIGGAMGAALEHRISRHVKKGAGNAIGKSVVGRGQQAIAAARNSGQSRIGGMADSIPVTAGATASAPAANGARPAQGPNARPAPAANGARPAQGQRTNAGTPPSAQDGGAAPVDSVDPTPAEVLDAAGVEDTRDRLAQDRAARAANRQLRQEANRGKSIVEEARRQSGNTRMAVAADRLRTHPVRTSLDAVRSAARAGGKAAKYGAMGVGVVGLAAFGGVPLGLAVGGYAAKRVVRARKNFVANAPARQANWERLASVWREDQARRFPEQPPPVPTPVPAEEQGNLFDEAGNPTFIDPEAPGQQGRLF